MLQWMGGSRRKVNTSRKSTQKRQKQYFEQRRRQMEHQQEAADGGKCSEGNRTYGQHSENNRSLDILSLLNISAVAQKQKSNITVGEKLEDETLNYQTLQHLPEVKSNEVKAQEHCKIEEARNSSIYRMELAYPKTISVSAPWNPEETLKTDGEKKNQLKMAPDCQLSVIDILEDDEPISSFRNNLAHEAHVAFSIEGLGKVEVETPVHSPGIHGRSFLHGCSSPPKAAKRANSSNDLMSEMANLGYDLDAMMRDIDLPFCRNSVEQPSCSKQRVDSFSKPRQKLAFEEFSLFNVRDNGLHDCLVDDELFYGIEDRNETTWKGSGIQADNILGSGFHSSDEDWMDTMYTSSDFPNSVNHRKKHTIFEDLDQQEKRTNMGRAGRLEPIETPLPNFKSHYMKNVSNFTLPDMRWHSSIGRNLDFVDVKDELGDYCFITEDARESSSLQSEESCSSTAVRSKLEGTLLNLKEKETVLDSDDIFHSECTFIEKKTPPRARSSKWTSLKGQVNGPEKLMRMSDPSRPTQVQFAATKKRSKPDHSRYFEQESNLGAQTSGCNPFIETSGTTKHVSSGTRLRTNDLFHTTSDIQSGSRRSCFERFCKSSASCLPSCNFVSETYDCCQPNMQNKSGSSTQSMFSTLGHKSHKPLDVHCCLAPEKTNIPTQPDETSGVQLSDDGNFELHRDEFSGTKSLLSANENSTDASESEVKCKDCKENTCKTSIMLENETENEFQPAVDRNCFQSAVDMSSLETSNIFNNKQRNADRKFQLTQTARLCQTGFRDMEAEDQQPKIRTIASDIQTTADSSGQVMLVDSCAMQLLCIRVLKEVYQWLIEGSQVDFL